MFLAEKFTGICPCGFSFTTPAGEDDAVAVMKYHAKLQHKKEHPNGATTAEAMKYIKKVK